MNTSLTASRGWLHPFGKPAQWIVLIALSAVASGVLFALGIPAALLLGPMIAGIVVASADGSIEPPRWVFGPVQGLLGCMIARMLPWSMATEITTHWLVFLAGVLSVIAMCAALGWVMTKMRMLPGTTAMWGLSPGAATVMTLMAQAYGADAQLVGTMQYLRVIFVAAIASVLMRALGAHATHAMSAADWFPAIAWMPFVCTLAIAVLGPVVGARLRVPGGALLLPLVVSAVLARQGWLHIELPRWLLVLAYAMVGWRIGLRFTRPLLRYAVRALPRMAAGIAMLIVLCGVLALGLVVFAGIDPLTAYLAMSPGGADSVAIIAATSHVDVPFVMSMQMARFVTVLLVGPALGRWMATATAPVDRPQMQDANEDA
ncbi:putative regulator AbrB [Pararobbsia alpina]|uniref:AbrB family transcriptional regulator n=1 Tax=Pararobbsia alpina TaxID=621374 RepID=UPI0039A72B01